MASSRFEGDVFTGSLPPIPSLRRVPEQGLAAALAVGGLEENDGMAEYALEGVVDFMARNPHWNVNHAGALCVYTLEFPDREGSWYCVVNALLRQKDRSKLTPHLPVFKLMALGVARLPAFSGNVWRGVKGDVSAVYRAMKEQKTPLREWAFQSTTTDIGVVKAFLGEGPRTLFHIHCASRTGSTITMPPPTSPTFTMS